MVTFDTLNTNPTRSICSPNTNHQTPSVECASSHVVRSMYRKTKLPGHTKSLEAVSNPLHLSCHERWDTDFIRVSTHTQRLKHPLYLGRFLPIRHLPSCTISRTIRHCRGILHWQGLYSQGHVSREWCHFLRTGGLRFSPRPC
jgi:hypothetical protein